MLSHVWLCNPMDCSLSGSSVHGIFQARTLEWVAISYSRRSSWSKDQTCVSCVFYIGRQTFCLSATWEDFCATYKKTCTINVHVTLIQNTTKLRTTQMSINSKWYTNCDIYIIQHAHVCMLSRVRLCDLLDASLSCSSVHGIFQARILEGVAIHFSRWFRDQTHISCIGREILYHWATREAYMIQYC